MAEEAPVHEHGLLLVGRCIEATDPASVDPGKAFALVIGYQKKYDWSPDPRHKLFYPASETCGEVWLQDDTNKNKYRIVSKETFPAWNSDRHISRRIWKSDDHSYFEAFLVIKGARSTYRYVDPRDDMLHEINLNIDPTREWGFLPVSESGWLKNEQPLKSWTYTPQGEPGPDFEEL